MVGPPSRRERKANALTEVEPATAAAADVSTGSVSRAPAKAAVIIDTAAAGVTVACAELSPEVAFRYQADRRSPAPPAVS